VGPVDSYRYAALTAKPMSLLALCYPTLSREDQRFVDEFRDRHDHTYRNVVKPHFTMVFQVHEMSEPVFTEHVERVADASSAIRFVCRYAMLHNDVSSDDYYVFLVPDEGFSELALLHDALYTKVLSSELRLDVPYVPHIGIATLKGPLRGKELADDLNRGRLSIGGKIEAISVVEYDGKGVTDLHHFPFGKNAT
jgi:2'-5' RNA ligase